MDTGAWEKIIKKMCREKGITPKEYAPLITTLAGILEKRDDALDLYEDTGGNPVVRHTNKGGATNIVKNPLLILWDDLNKSALAYWRELECHVVAVVRAFVAKLDCFLANVGDG